MAWLQMNGIIYMKIPRVNMAITEEAMTAPKDVVAPAKAVLGGVGSGMIVGIMVGSAASLGVIVGDSVLTTGAAVGDEVGNRVGSAVAVHLSPLKHCPPPLQEQMAIR